ncbi:hypothetical protein BGX24_000676 [Mortierella sp. AD032]|nr:hypothetical protein BGX24_000676 [Mortierella sp. AD032]
MEPGGGLVARLSRGVVSAKHPPPGTEGAGNLLDSAHVETEDDDDAAAVTDDKDGCESGGFLRDRKEAPGAEDGMLEEGEGEADDDDDDVDDKDDGSLTLGNGNDDKGDGTSRDEEFDGLLPDPVGLGVACGGELTWKTEIDDEKVAAVLAEAGDVMNCDGFCCWDDPEGGVESVGTAAIATKLRLLVPAPAVDSLLL